jgi:hypothetical protein
MGLHWIFANQICESVYTGGGVRERERERERESERE